jgi:hypothetical protein
MTQPAQLAALTEAARQQQLTIRKQLLADVARLWPLLARGKLTERWPGWLQVMTTLILQYQARSAAAGSAFYRATRAVAVGGDGAELIQLAPPPTADWIAGALGFAAAGTLARTDLPPARATQTALTQTLGTAGRLVLSGGRDTVADTVRRDPAAVGYYRKTDAQPCYFCALLASRGLVYKDDSFNRSNRRFDGDGESKVHNHCGCILAPAFSRDVELPEASRRALQVYRDSTGGVRNAGRINAFRRAWESSAA